MRPLTALTLLGIVGAATLLFYVFVHQVSSVWLDVALRPELRDALERSMNDQKRMRSLDPEHAEAYRKQFEETQRLLHRIDVIRMNRQAMLQRFELALVALFVVAVAIGGTIAWSRSRRAAERRRAESVARFASWQEAARRHAHEIRTPLTAARLEIDRLVSLARMPAPAEEVNAAVSSVYEELDRLARFTREFSSFAAVAQPVLQTEDLQKIVAEFCAIFANAFPGLALKHNEGTATMVLVDRDMLRQVLVNLCTNSARAGSDEVAFAIARDRTHVVLDVSDRGSGIPESIRARVFDPYVTTRKVGEGMGLGLAISRKILLDHGGDLTLLTTSDAGTTFRLFLQRA